MRLLEGARQFFYSMMLANKSGAPNKNIEPETSIYNIAVKDINGNSFKLEKYRGKFMLIVNVASECGYTPQYAQLEELFEKYREKLVVLGFPSNEFGGQEPGTEKEILDFCQVNYHVTFPMFSKLLTSGSQDNIYRWLTDKKLNGWNDSKPQWNFYKYFVDPDGKLLNCFSQHVSPFDENIISALEDS
jgi:glutathione peroxidase